jgi:hypothetical protein
LLFGLLGCAGEISEEGTTESRPLEDADQAVALKRGSVHCAARSDTGYDRGRSFPITVIEVDGKPVERDTANAFVNLRDAAARDGVSVHIVSGFRTYEEQHHLYYTCYRACRCNHCNLAAPPGYSNHNSGYALDLNTEGPGVLRWLNLNADRFSFRRTVPSEDWHWEYQGGAVPDGACRDGVAQGGGMRFEGLEPGGWYRNGQWLKVMATDARVHHVRYFAEAWPIGASEDAGHGFPSRVSLNTLGQRTFIARGYDADDAEIAQAQVTVKITEGEPYQAPLRFAAPREAGWYRNGVWMKVEPRPDLARVAYFAGPYELGEGVDAEQGFARRVELHTVGVRTLEAVGYDADGRVVGRGAVTLKVLPAGG